MQSFHIQQSWYNKASDWHIDEDINMIGYKDIFDLQST